MKYLLIRRLEDFEVIAIVQISDRADIMVWTLHTDGGLNELGHNAKFISSAEYGTYEMFGFPVFAYILYGSTLKVYDPEHFTNDGLYVIIRKNESPNFFKRALRALNINTRRR